MDAIAQPAADLNESRFMRQLIRHLAGTLQDVIGMDDAEGFISVVGQRMGDDINASYRKALNVERLDREQISDVLVDLKKKINGDFYVICEDEDKIVLGNRRCPFGDMVRDRPSLCMMTSNVFGAIAADNAGYSKVHLSQTIAGGASECRVTVFLTANEESRETTGREYFEVPRS